MEILCNRYAVVAVSILVIMDLALELIHPDVIKYAELGFNPCYNGSCFGIGRVVHGSGSRYVVSILVIMD
ncbi:MAG: hypothetical protein PWP63_2110, partial [Methanolobus sp.]|nr:hypothetical protein [Methanolobus sp.]